MMGERRAPIIVLIVWASALTASFIISTWRSVEIAKRTFEGVVTEGPDEQAMMDFRNLILLGEGLRMLTPALGMAACLTLVALVTVLAIRWERREHGTPPVAPTHAEATTAS